MNLTVFETVKTLYEVGIQFLSIRAAKQGREAILLLIFRTGVKVDVLQEAVQKNY